MLFIVYNRHLALSFRYYLNYTTRLEDYMCVSVFELRGEGRKIKNICEF